MRSLPLMLALVACGTQFRFINEGDRPGSELGLPPPAEFQACMKAGSAYEHLDSDGNGRPDGVRVVKDGKEVCRGTDTNLDGKLDTWELVEEGRVTARAHDSDGNGLVDKIWIFPDATRPHCAVVDTDKDGDGKGDGLKVDACGLLANKPPELVPGVPGLPPPPVLPPQPPPSKP